MRRGTGFHETCLLSHSNFKGRAIALGMDLLLDTDAKLLAPDSEYVEFCIGTLRRSLVSEYGSEFLQLKRRATISCGVAMMIIRK